MPWTLGLDWGRRTRLLVKGGGRRTRRLRSRYPFRRRPWRFEMKNCRAQGENAIVVVLWAFLCFLLVNFCVRGGGTHNRPLPLLPSAIVRFSPSFLICIATCCFPCQLFANGNFPLSTQAGDETHLPQIRSRLCFLLTKAADGLALCDREYSCGIPRWVSMPFAARGSGVPQCAFQRHCAADDDVVVVLAAHQRREGVAPACTKSGRDVRLEEGRYELGAVGISLSSLKDSF